MEMPEIDFTYITQPPSRYTFKQPKLKQWVEKWCIGKTLNLFCGKVFLDIDEIRNDIDEDMPAHYHMDAFEFVTSWDKCKFKTIILDPPYNIRKAREKYHSKWIGKLTQVKGTLLNIIEPGARIISLGYDTVGMGYQRGFKKLAICLVCHNGDHNDTIGLVEELVQTKLDLR